jgi:3-oxoacyl-[acyl-carrier protein] reductase
MNNPLTEKPVILISGTRKGLGKSFVEHFSKKNFIIVGCSRKPVDYDVENYHHFCLDISDEKKIKQMFLFIRKEFGRLDILINNAGVGSMNHSLLIPISTVHKILDTNVVGNLLLSRESAKIMKKNKFGRIVNLTSFAVPFKLEGEAIYAASKAAIISLTETLSKEYADYGITVNAVAPPAVQTDLIKAVPKEKMDALLKRQTIHRYGTPEEVCDVIDFFIDKNNNMITGQVVYMGGV